MRNLIATKNLTVEQWLTERRKGICGSDASIILGINPYTSVLKLWEDKTNRIPVEEKENDYTYFGHVMEPVIKKEFMKRTGLKVRIKNYILQSEEYPWMLADVDGIVKEEDGTFALFEAKTASEYKRGTWEEKVPDEYYAQVQHYLCVTGFDKAYVCAIVGGNSYFCHEVMRDDRYIQMLIEKEQEFWQCVVTDAEPLPDGSKATSDYLSQRYSLGEKKVVELPDSVATLAESYLELDQSVKELSAKKDAVANHLKSYLKENEKGIAGERIINWQTIQKRTLNTEKAKKALGAAYETCLTESSYRRFSVA